MRITKTHTFFYRDRIAQWHKANMFDQESGFIFNTAEQYMMYQKAQLFGDYHMSYKIINSVDPREQKNFGRQVANYDEQIWQANREKIVYNGNLLKFTQHPYLLADLFSTGDTQLVEASPTDLIWGVGFREDDPKIDNPDNWKGLNLLGKVLTQVRDDIKLNLSQIPMKQIK